MPLSSSSSASDSACAVSPSNRNAVISRTEIEQRLKGIIADRLAISPSNIHDGSGLARDLNAGNIDIGCIVGTAQARFDVQINDFWTDTPAFLERITFGELVGLVEGGIRS